MRTVACRPCSPFWRATTPITTMPSSFYDLVLGTYGEHEDFFKMKGEIEAFLRGMNVPEARYTAEKHDPTFHPAAAPASAWAASTSAASARSIRSWPAATALTARFLPQS